jgi:hypothetical protein
MPRAIKPKTGHGRTAVKIPFSDKTIQAAAKRLICGDWPKTFTDAELTGFLEKVTMTYAGCFFDGTRPNEPEKKAALKHLKNSAEKLMKAARNFYLCLDELDIDTRKYFTIQGLETAEQSAQLLHGQACVAMNDLKNRLDRAGRPAKALQSEVALAVINELDEKFPDRLVRSEPFIGHGGIRVEYARYDGRCLEFARTLMQQAFPRMKDGAIRKTIETALNQKFNF